MRGEDRQDDRGRRAPSRVEFGLGAARKGPLRDDIGRPQRLRQPDARALLLEAAIERDQLGIPLPRARERRVDGERRTDVERRGNRRGSIERVGKELRALMRREGAEVPAA